MQNLPSEDLYAFHIDQQIISFFASLGYFVSLIDKPTRRREADLGFDSLFKYSGNLKYFALQYKRPISFDASQTKFVITDKHQYKILEANKDWMLYCLPLFTSYSNLQSVLHHSAFMPADFWEDEAHSKTVNLDSVLAHVPDKDPIIYSRWGSVFERLSNCTFGIKEENKEMIQKMSEKAYDLFNTSFYVIDLENKRVRIVTNYLTNDKHLG